MAKRKISKFSKESSSDSDDMNNSNIGHNSKKRSLEDNHGGIKKKKKELGTKTLIKDELSSDSEVEDDNLQIPKQMIENLRDELHKKQSRKRRKEEVSSSEDSSARETVKAKQKLSKKEKRKLSNNYESPKSERNNEDEDEEETEYVNRKILNQVNLHIKKEISSDNANSEAESNSNCLSKYNKSNETIKQEAHTTSDSDSVDSVSGTPEHRIKSLTKKSPSVTILQDVRFTPKTPKEKLKELYPGLKPIESTELKLSDSDEIYLFRMPKNVDPHLLKNIEIDLENQCKIKLGEKYLVTPTTKVPDPTFVIGANSRVLQFKNNIKMEKYIKSKAEPKITVPEKKNVPLPDNLKNRHPLFGSDFQEKIVLSEDVEKKLDLAIQNLLKRQRKSKKKKEKKHRHPDSSEEPNQEILNLFNFNIKKETSDDSAFGSSSSVDRHRDKKKVSQKNIDEEEEFATDTSKHKTPKKKKKRSEDKSSPGVSNIKQEFQDDDFETYEKHLSRVNSTLMSDILKTPKFNPELSTIQSEASTSGKKSKKSKSDKKSKGESSVKKEELISDLINDVVVEMNTSKKIKTELKCELKS